MKRRKRINLGPLLFGVLIFCLSPGRQNTASALRPSAPPRPFYYPPLLPEPPQNSLTQNGIFYRLSLNRATYRRGERAVVELLVENRTGQAVAFRSRDGAAGPSFSAGKGNEMLWNWPPSESPRPWSSREWFDPGLTKIYRVTWEQKDQAGRPLPPGEYTLTATFPPLEEDLTDRQKRTELTVQFSVAGRGEAPPGPVFPSGLSAALQSDKANYAPGEPVRLRLTVTNNANSPLSFRSRSAQRYDFVIRSGDKEIWRWSHDRVFAMMLTSWQLAPGQSVTYEETWPQTDNSGRPAPAGRCTAEAWQIGAPRAQAEFTVR